MQGIYSKCKVSQSSPDCPDTASFCIAYTCEDEFLSFSGHYAAVPNAASITFTSVPGTLEFYDFNFNFLAINTITFTAPGFPSLNLLYEDAGVYQFIIEIKDANGNCLNIVKYTIIVYPNFVADALIQISPNPVCVGEMVTISSGLDNALHQYCWTFDPPYNQYNNLNCQYNSSDASSITFEVTSPDDIFGVLSINGFCNGEQSFPFHIKVISLEIKDVLITETNCKTYSYTPQINCGTAPYSYNWSFTGGTPSTSTIENPSVQYVGTGNFAFSLIVTDANGNTASYNGNTTVPPNPSFPLITASPNFSPLNSCTQDLTFSVTNINAQSTYTWLTSTGLSGTGTNAGPFTFPSSGGNITFTVTDEHHCIASAPRQILPCCGDFSDPEKVIVVPQQFATSLVAFKNEYDNSIHDLNPSSGVFHPNKVFVFNYDMNINAGNFTFEGASTITNNLLFGANVRWIISSPSQNLTFNNCWLTVACEDYMWGGIENNHQTSSVTFNNNSKVEYAKKAIRSSSGGVVNALNTTFDKNYIGIEITGGTNFSVPNPVTVHACTFDCSGPLLLPYTNDVITQQASLSFAGINLIDCYGQNGSTNEIIIGGTQQSHTNTFNKLYNGIRVINSRTQITDFNIFSNIRRNPPQSGNAYYNGVAIFVNNPSATLSSNLIMTGGSVNNILDCDKGIELRSNRVSANISHINMQDTERGIDIVNPINSDISIRDCRINNCQIGIKCSASNSNNITIAENSILLAPFGQSPFAGINCGITLTKPLHTPFVFYRVNCNTILTNRNSRGINLSGQLSTCDVSGNKIYHNETPSSNSNSWGIYAVNCNGSNIYDNLVNTFDNTLSTARNGVFLANNSRLNVNCNTLNRNFTGFRLMFDNPDLRLNGNTLQTHCLGIDATPQTIGYNFFSSTKGSDNKYDGPFISVGGTTARQVRNGFQHLIDIKHSSQVFPPNNVTGNINAISLGTLNQYFCNSYNCNNHSQSITVTDSTLIDSAEHYIAEQSITDWDTWYQNALNRELQKFVYENILKAPVIYLTIPEFAELFESIQNTEIPSLFWAYEELLNLTDTLGNSLTDSLYLQKLHTIQQILAELSCNSLSAINERIVYSIYSNTLASGIDTLNYEYQFILEDIASQCPFSGGSTVYDAIALLNTFNPELSFNLVENCINNGFKIEESLFESILLTDSVKNNIIIVYPNPTQGSLSIINSSNESILFKLYDITGRLIATHNIGANSRLEINTLLLIPDGIYFYHTIGSVNYFGKIVKSK